MNSLIVIREILSLYPSLDVRYERLSVEVMPSDSSGFSVCFEIDDDPEYTVYFGEWAQNLSDVAGPDEAIGLFLWALSDDCRLWIPVGCDIKYEWAVQDKRDEQWHFVGRAGRIQGEFSSAPGPYAEGAQIQCFQNSAICPTEVTALARAGLSLRARRFLSRRYQPEEWYLRAEFADYFPEYERIERYEMLERDLGWPNPLGSYFNATDKDRCVERFVGLPLGIFIVMALHGTLAMTFTDLWGGSIGIRVFGFLLTLAMLYFPVLCFQMIRPPEYSRLLIWSRVPYLVAWTALVHPLWNIFTGRLMSDTYTTSLETAGFVALFFGLRMLADRIEARVDNASDSKATAV